MTLLGVQSEYVEYMMGHKQSSYLDIESRGVEFLRNIYATAGLTLKPKPAASEEETLRNMLRALGYEVYKTADGKLILGKVPTAQLLMITADGNRSNSVRELFLEAMKSELAAENNPKNPNSSRTCINLNYIV